MHQRCELEKEVLKNTLSFASLQPDEFVYKMKIMKGLGYMAVTAGETIHVIKCISVDTVIRRTMLFRASHNSAKCLTLLNS